ncbi:RING-type E3 ubiquitin transferase [Sarracenia purpurea var. burkii]
MDSSSSRRSLQAPTSTTSRRNFVSKRIEPAIRCKSCPICLSRIVDRKAAVIAACLHAFCVECIRKWSNLKRKCPLCNADFDSLFFKINLSSRTFLKQQLPALAEDGKVKIEAIRRRRLDPLSEQRRSREESHCFSWQTRPLPRRRWFRRSISESADAVAERILQWRASIYDQQLQAVPCFSRSCVKQNTPGINAVKERIRKRMEPWILRELQAILGDPDPTVIVHVVSSLFISSLEEKREVPTEQSVLEDDYLEPLQPFLHERTTMFWHELRFFKVTTETPLFLLALLLCPSSIVYHELRAKWQYGA